jgi:hypothetical protein
MSFFLATFLYSLGVNIGTALTALVCLCIVIACISGFCFMCISDAIDKGVHVSDDDKAIYKKSLTFMKRSVIYFLPVLLFLDFAWPTEKNLQLMLGAYVVDRTIELPGVKDELKRLPGEALKTVNVSLESLAGFAKDLTKVID